MGVNKWLEYCFQPVFRQRNKQLFILLLTELMVCK